MEDLPLSLVEHELGHLLGGLLSGATSGVIHHDGESWRCDLTWPVAQPSEAQVVAPHVVGVHIRGEHASGDDRFLAAVVPQHLKDASAALAVAVREELDRRGRAFLAQVQATLLERGSFSLKRAMRVN